MIGPGHKTPCRQQRRAIGGKWQQAGSPGHGNQPATALLRGVPRKDTGIARIQGLPEKSPPWAHGDEWSHPCLRRPYRCPFGRAGTNESTTPPGRQRNPGNRAIQKTGQQKSPTLPAAYQQGQAFGGGVNLGFGVPPQRAHAGNGGGERGIRTPEGLLTLTRFPGVRLKPLIHLSGIRQYSSICGRCGKHDEKSPHAHATLPHMSRPSHHAPGPSPDTAGPEYPDTGACHAPVRVPACPVAGSLRPCQPK